jgi:GNAT acetyltransferase-like protein
MSTDNKSKYQHFCERETEVPIFARPWYLDAVCQSANEDWDVVLIEKSEKVIASLPFQKKKSGPFSVSTMPFLTKFLGPYLSRDFRSPKQAHKVIKELIESLPTFAFFNQNCFYDLTDWLPFYWKGFQQTTQYSYVLDDLSDLEKVYQNFSPDYRNNKIKKAKESVHIVMDRSIEDYYKVEAMSFERQGMAFPLSLEYLKKYDEAVTLHNARRLFFAVDDQGQIHSVVYLLIDHDRVYYHMAGDNPELRSSGAGILLVWEAIQYTRNELGLNIFDFEGSTIKSIERVRRQFGAQQVPYFNISKYGSKLYQWMRILRK